MRHSSLIAFLSGALSPQAFANEIAPEVATFYASLRETRTARIRISGGPNFLLTKDGARRLLRAVANQEIPFDAAVYVADCIVASDAIRFADDDVREAIFFVEDDSRVPSRAETLEALALLG